MQLKPGARLRSAACETEVVVVKATRDGELGCGGAAMAPLDGDVESVELDPGFASGSALGKRYTDEAGEVEILVVKAGAGSLSLDGTPLDIKSAKPLPSSD